MMSHSGEQDCCCSLRRCPQLTSSPVSDKCSRKKYNTRADNRNPRTKPRMSPSYFPSSRFVMGGYCRTTCNSLVKPTSASILSAGPKGALERLEPAVDGLGYVFALCLAV